MEEPFKETLEELRTRLLSHLRHRTGLTGTLVEVTEATYCVTHPAVPDALIDEEDFARDERLPYWAELWPSAVALARYISNEDLADRRAVELGCGLGLPSVVSLAQGASITATDHYEAALDFTRYNARTNLDLELKTRILDWHEPVVQTLDSFDLVLAADVLYEGRHVVALSALIPTLLAPGGEILLADPNRKYTPTFLKSMREKGFRSATEEHDVSLDGQEEIAILIHRLRR